MKEANCLIGGLKLVIIVALAQFGVVNQAFAAPGDLELAVKQPHSLVVSCDSEDDGEVTEVFQEIAFGSLSFQGDTGALSRNAQIKIRVHAENFERVSRRKFVGLVEMCLMDSETNLAWACATSEKTVVSTDSKTRFDIYVPGASTDPEGINCYAQLR